MKVEERRCDRCNKRTANEGSGEWKLTCYELNHIDLCNDCRQALKLFMAGEDQVGSTYFVKVDGPCPHHISCAYPCTTVWEERSRK